MIDGVKVVIAIAIAIMVSQLTKILIAKLKYKEVFDWRDFFLTGGMPSAHTATVTTLALSIFLIQGASVAFAITIGLGFIVIRDALGVRRTVGEGGRAINDIIKVIDDLIKTKKNKLKPVKYSLGHTPADVNIGMVIGAVSALIVLVL